MTIMHKSDKGDVVAELYASGHSELLRRELNELPQLKKLLGAEDADRENRFKAIIQTAVDNLQKVGAKFSEGYSANDIDVAVTLELQRMEHRLAAGRTAEAKETDIVLTGMLHPRQVDALKGAIEDIPGIRRLLGGNPEKTAKLDFVLGTIVDLLLESGKPRSSFESLEQMDRNEIVELIRDEIKVTPVLVSNLIKNFESKQAAR